MSDENKELFDKKLTELKCAVKEYKKQWEGIYKDLQEKGSDYGVIAKEKLTNLYDEHKDKIESFKAEAPEKAEMLLWKLMDSFEEMKKKMSEKK
jgi:hypothetical protein